MGATDNRWVASYMGVLYAAQYRSMFGAAFKLLELCDMKTQAAVAFGAGKPLEIVEVDLDGPQAGEVLVELKATGICHTDEFTRSGADPEGAFPAILGHEGAGIVLAANAIIAFTPRPIFAKRFAVLKAKV